jgi:hypothetical protein
MGRKRRNPGERPVIAFGPEMPGWGSWEWVGADLQQELSKYFQTVSFATHAVPSCDVAVIIKHPFHLELVEELANRAAVIYCPVDFYGSCAEIDSDGKMLRKCSRIVVHSENLCRYFAAYAPVEYIDHHVKFIAPLRKEFFSKGFILWAGVRTNLPPFVDWVNEHSLSGEMGQVRILTNLEDPAAIPKAVELGFNRGDSIRVRNWSRQAQIELTSKAKAAIDIKGSDFRSRHKPPAKAIDFIASGVPLAMNLESSPAEHLARMGFEVASPLDTERWFCRNYWLETQTFGRLLRELLSLERVGRRWKRIIHEVLRESLTSARRFC